MLQHGYGSRGQAGSASWSRFGACGGRLPLPLLGRGWGSRFTAGRVSPVGCPCLDGLPARRGRPSGTTGGLQSGSRGSRAGGSFTQGSGGGGGRRRPRAAPTLKHRYHLCFSLSAGCPGLKGVVYLGLNRRCQSRPLLRNHCRSLQHGNGPRGQAQSALWGRFGACGRRLPLLLLGCGVGGADSPQAVCRRLGAHAGVGCRRDAAVLREPPMNLGSAHAGAAPASASLQAVGSPAVGGVHAPFARGNTVIPLLQPLCRMPRPERRGLLGTEPELPEPASSPERLPNASARERPQGAGWVCPLGPVRCVRRTLAASASGVGPGGLIQRRPCVAGWVPAPGWAAGETRPSLWNG